MALLRRLVGRAGLGSDLAAPAREALTGVLANPTFELIPLKNVREQAGFLPAGATVSVTASPAKGIEATLDLAVALEAQGFRAIPHLSARMIRDRAHLADVLARLQASGIHRAFVVGGDAEDPGEFLDGLSLLRAMAELGDAPSDIGVPCYPQGHAVIPQPALLQALPEFSFGRGGHLALPVAGLKPQHIPLGRVCNLAGEFPPCVRLAHQHRV